MRFIKQASWTVNRVNYHLALRKEKGGGNGRISPANIQYRFRITS